MFWMFWFGITFAVLGLASLFTLAKVTGAGLLLSLGWQTFIGHASVIGFLVGVLLMIFGVVA